MTHRMSVGELRSNINLDMDGIVKVSGSVSPIAQARGDADEEDGPPRVSEHFPEYLEKSASCCDTWTYGWMTTLVSLTHEGYQLKDEDTPPVAPDEDVEVVAGMLREGIRACQGDLSWAVWHAFGPSYVRDGLTLRTLSLTLQVLQIFCLREVVNFASGQNKDNQTTAIVYACGLAGCAVVTSFIMSKTFWRSCRVGMRAQAALMHLVYEKVLDVKQTSLTDSGWTTGGVTNMVCLLRMGMFVDLSLLYTHTCCSYTWTGNFALRFLYLFVHTTETYFSIFSCPVVLYV
jgi:hypothetical protein